MAVPLTSNHSTSEEQVMRQHLRNLLIAASALSLSACGGGGTRIASIPNPQLTPTPTPTPAPTPAPTPTPTSAPIPPAHIGLVSPAPFAVLGVGDTYSTDSAGQHPTLLSGPSAQNVQFSYDPASESYFISLPGFQRGILDETGYSGSVGQVATASTSGVLELSFGFAQPVFVTLPVPGSTFSPYTYTSFGSWDGRTGTTGTGDNLRAEGIFAYGIPTVVGDVPITGSASYTAEIQGALWPKTDYPVGGDVNLLFNFAGGTLGGSMHPTIEDHLAGFVVDFGHFDFTQTVYSTGSTSFSGKFTVPGVPNADSSFNGIFTGPQAAELMAQFQTQFILNGDQGIISGVWVGKKN
jgi:hypothetical protein